MNERMGQYLCPIIVAALVVGQLEFAERHFLSHPVGAGVRRVRVQVHPVPCVQQYEHDQSALLLSFHNTNNTTTTLIFTRACKHLYLILGLNPDTKHMC